MSDLPLSKNSAADASKNFAIPSRPSAAPANGQNVPAWQIADQREEQFPAGESVHLPEPAPAREMNARLAELDPSASATQIRSHQSSRFPGRASAALRQQDAPAPEQRPAEPHSVPNRPAFPTGSLQNRNSAPPSFPTGSLQNGAPSSFPTGPLQNQSTARPAFPTGPFQAPDGTQSFFPTGPFQPPREAEPSFPLPASFQNQYGSDATFPQPPAFQSQRAPGQSFSEWFAIQNQRGQEQPPAQQPQWPSARPWSNEGANGGYTRPPGAGSLTPSQPASLQKPRAGRRTLYIALAIIALVVVVGGLLSQQLLSTANTNTALNSALVFSGSGPYAQFPLTPDQINNIQHLAGHMKYKALANLYVSHMSLDDEIGQLIMIEYNQPTYSSDLDYMLHTLHVGGVIMYEFQMTTATQTKNDIAKMQERANIPLLVSTDEEGGPYVHRLSNIYGYRMSATQIYESGSTDVAKQQGLKTSKDLAALGINEDLAPDVDVNQVNGYDMVTRTFGNTASDVIKYAGAYLQAMQGNGTVACIKHFPGLGGALTDAHKGLPVVHSTEQQIYDIDLAPFKAFIQSPNALLNPGMIMPTDVLLPAIDAKYPAELSYTFMTKILRQEFGYDGVSLTDALYMQGITDTWDMYTASVMALQAGNDMLLGANGTQQTIGVINAIKQALKDGTLTKARIDESVTRIIALKMQYHLMPTYIPGA